MRSDSVVTDRRHWLPAVLLAAATILELQVGALGGWLALAPPRARLLEQATATGLWLAATLAGVTLLTSILNTAAARRTGHRLPRLVTDLLAVVVWLAAGIGIASQVFDRPVAGLIATSSVALAVLGFAMRDTIASLVAAVAINVEGPPTTSPTGSACPMATRRGSRRSAGSPRVPSPAIGSGWCCPTASSPPASTRTTAHLGGSGGTTSTSRSMPRCCRRAWPPCSRQHCSMSRCSAVGRPTGAPTSCWTRSPWTGRDGGCATGSTTTAGRSS